MKQFHCVKGAIMALIIAGSCLAASATIVDPNPIPPIVKSKIPKAPTSVTAASASSSSQSEGDFTSATVSWTDNSINEGGFGVHVFDANGNPIMDPSNLMNPLYCYTAANATSCTFNNTLPVGYLNSGTNQAHTFKFKVSAHNEYGSGVSTFSPVITTVTAPATSTNVIAVATSSSSQSEGDFTSATVSWTDNSINEGGFGVHVFDANGNPIMDPSNLMNPLYCYTAAKRNNHVHLTTLFLLDI